MKIKNMVEGDSQNMLGSITSWHSLGLVLGMSVKRLAFSLTFRDDMQKRIIIGDRTVYKSDYALQYVQVRLAALLSPLIEKAPDNDVVLAYRKRNYVDTLKECTGASRLIGWDIRKFYDNIKLEHITKALMAYGFNQAGAKLVGRYCIVKTARGHTLQQGCAASPAISNLVGYEFIDRHVLAWLRENCPVAYRYVRYCDNVELFLFEDMPEGFYEKYKAFITALLKKNGFRSHDWINVGQNNPKKNMRFLGIVLNKVLRIEKHKFDNLRATLFNMCVNNISHEIIRYLQTVKENKTYTDSFNKAESLAAIGGYISYIKPINSKYYKQVRKLYLVAKNRADYISPSVTEPGDLTEYTKTQEWVNFVKSYRNDQESIEDFVERVVEQGYNAVARRLGIQIR